MQRWWWIPLFGLCACATGRPVGAFTTASALRYRPTTPAAAARPTAPHLEPTRPIQRPVLGSREVVLARARALIGQRSLKVEGRSYASACNGLVEAAYHGMGVDLHAVARSGDNAVTALYRVAQQHGRIFHDALPLPGDLVFFRDTYDLNRDARANDGLTHVGLVEAVDADGTVSVIHHVSRGVVRYRMNPGKPSVRRDASTGKVLNDALRSSGRGRRVATTGELFVAFGALLPSSGPVASR